MASILQLLAQKTGKSVDELMETLGKKAASTADDIPDSTVMSNLQKEAADASVPVGSGKNLEALQRASDDIQGTPATNIAKLQEMERGSLNAPFVDTERNVNTQNMGMLFSDAPEAAGYKMPDTSGIRATKAAPDSLATTASKLEGTVDLDKLNKMDPRLKGIAAALGLGGLGYGMMGGEDEQQIPMAPGIAKSQAPTPEAQVAQAKITPVERAKSVDSISKAQQATSEIEPLSESDQSDYSDLMLEAQKSSNQNDFYNHLLRAANQAGAGIASLGAGSQVKADYSGVEALEKTAGKPVSNIKGLMETKSADQKLKAAQSEINDDNKMRDPNSEVSRLTTELAIKAGLIKPGSSMSAMALKNSGVNIGNLLSTIEAGKARKESAALQREAMAASKGETNKLKIQGSVDRQVSQLLKSKDYEAYNAAKDAKSALDFALESGDKTASGSAFMQFAKIAQGDNSVVRDGDMAILAGGYNYTSPAQMITKLAAKAAGGNFNDSELKQMKAVAEKVQAIKGRRVQQLMSPVIERSEAAGLNLEESLDPAMIGEFSGKPEVLTTSGTRTFKSNQAPGSIVTVKSGKKYKIGADGVTGTEIP